MLSEAILLSAAVALTIDLAIAVRPVTNPGGNVGQGGPTTNADLDCDFVWMDFGVRQPEAIGVCVSTVMEDGSVSFMSLYESTPWPRVYNLGYALPDCAGAGIERWAVNVTEADTHLDTGYLCAVISWHETSERIFDNGTVVETGTFAAFVQIDACIPGTYKFDKCKNGKAQQHYYKDEACSPGQRWAPGKLHEISESESGGWDFFSYQRAFHDGRTTDYRLLLPQTEEGARFPDGLQRQFTATQVRCIAREESD